MSACTVIIVVAVAKLSGACRVHTRARTQVHLLDRAGDTGGERGARRGRLQAARRRVGRYGSIDGRMHDDGGAAVAAVAARGDLYKL